MKEEFTKEFQISCDCAGTCGILAIGKWNDDNTEKGDGYLAYYEAGFYSNQKSHFKETLKLIWAAIRGRRFCFYEVIIPNDRWQEFKEFIAST
jgi:hypothetical protein